MGHQSLYRRYRSQRFSELRGQDHVTSALQSAVEGDRHGHAYLFSGPRGTGKTSTARILAKALNCENVTNGEPCCECDSCVAIEQGRSLDLHELDAASHNKVDDIRDLISRVNLGSPGKTKVYILDEVHMLSAGAENALLKTLEEPPEHVVFVLATTEPHKVVDTILSRTQHFEFHLLPADELAEHVRYVIEDAGLDVDDDAVDYVLRQGGGSARDTLSALDLVAAAGGVPAGSDIGAELAAAIGAGDPAAAMASVQAALTHGREPRVIGEETLEVLRNSFLASMGTDLNHLSEHARAKSAELAAALGPATVTQALEALGQALVEMRQAADPRIPLEVTVLRLTRQRAGGPDPTSAPEVGAATAASPDVDRLHQRIASLEATVAQLQASVGAVQAPEPSPSPDSAASAATTQSAVADDPPARESSGPAAMARSRLRSIAGQSSGGAKPPSTDPAGSSIEPESTPRPTTEPNPSPEPQSAVPTAPIHTGGPTPTVSQASAVVDESLAEVSQRVRVRFNVGSVQGVDATETGLSLVIGVPNAHYQERCDDVKGELEQAVGARLGAAVAITVVVDDSQSSAPLDPVKAPPRKRPTDNAIEDVGPIEELEDATDQSASGIDRLTNAFPGSTVVDTGAQSS